MIIVSLNSGLGNQMFQYATGMALASRNNTSLILDLSWFEANTARHYQLHHFAITAREVSEREKTKFTSVYDGICKKAVRYMAKKYLNRRLYREAHFNYDPELFRRKKNTWIEGYWQSEKYFGAIAQDITREFRIRTPLSAKTIETKKLIYSTESVSVHVRRGDYVAEDNRKKIHGPLEISYYARALDIIARKTKYPHLFIFSDDMSWVKENLRFEYPATYVDHNDESTGFEDLHLMSGCRHNVIANSTFSWWGAWLNRNPSKIVIAPKQWFPDPDMNNLTGDLIPDSWVRL